MKVHLVVLMVSFVWCGASPRHEATEGEDLIVPCFAHKPGWWILCKNVCDKDNNILFDSSNATWRDSRYSIVQKESMTQVRIKNVRVSDSGTYECRLKNRKEVGHMFEVSVTPGPRHHHWLVLAVVMVMISVLVLGIYTKKKTVNAHYDENNEIDVLCSADLELADTSRFPPTETEYENMRAVSEPAIYQSLCVETMDPNETYYSVALD